MAGRLEVGGLHVLPPIASSARWYETLNGMSMLVWQAVVAHEKWDGSVYDKDDIAKLCIDSAEELKNR